MAINLTRRNLKEEKPNFIGGKQRIYKFKNGWGLSLINSPLAHSYPFAWEAAVLDAEGRLDYKTPLTSDVEVFKTVKEANAFIEKARRYFDAS